MSQIPDNSQAGTLLTLCWYLPTFEERPQDYKQLISNFKKKLISNRPVQVWRLAILKLWDGMKKLEYGHAANYIFK